jgi:sugar phosphate isomerase/epimerase
MTEHPRGGIGLEYLSVFGMPLPDYVALAARLECDFVTVNFRGAANAQAYPAPEALKESRSTRRRFAAALVDHGMRLQLVEGFAVTADSSAEDRATDLDAVAQLGARSICAVSLDKDIGRTIAQFAGLADVAAARGLLLTTEVGAGVVRNIHTAIAIWRDVANPNFSLLLDAMHFFRRGGTVKDLDALPPNAIGHVQLCDVPMPAQIESYMEEALFERRCPGDGDLPLTDFLASIPKTVPIGLEVPIRSAENVLETVLRSCLSRTRELVNLS